MANVYEKISAVMQDVAYLQKDDTVGYGRTSYKAITEEKVTGTIRKALIQHGLVIVPIAMEHRRDDTPVRDKDGNEKVNRLTTVDVTYKIVNIEDPQDYVTAVSSGTGVDTQDKGVGKAMTYAYKYLLLRTFAIPTGEDPDKTASAELDAQYTPQYISERQFRNLVDLCKLHGKDMAYLLDTAEAQSASEITQAGYAKVVKALQ